MEKKKKAIIYCRVSTTKQQQHGDSLNDQERKCRDYCKTNNMDVVKVFKDGFTGTTIKRPGLEALMEYASGRNDIQYCIIKHIDRSSRGGVEVYEKMKKGLSNLGIQLRDTHGIIQDRLRVINNISGYLPEYNFCYSEPSRISETVTAISSQEEKDQILRRTIPQEISNERNGYHVRNSNFGYQNQKIKTQSGKKTIQVKDPLIGDLVIELFKERAKGLLSDTDIVHNINMKGLRTRHNKKITVKYFQSIIKKPIYAGVIISKWTSYEPIKTAYSGLISIDIWNKANKGKKTLIELKDGGIQYIEGNVIKDNNTIKRRKKFNPELPFRNLVKSSEIPGKMISGSFSNPSRSKSTGYYHPIRKTGEKGENIKKNKFEEEIISIFNEIQINDVIKVIFEDRFDKIFKTNKQKVYKDINTYQEELKRVEREINYQEDKICEINPGLERVLQTIENKLLSLEDEKKQISKKIEEFKISGYCDPENFKEFCFYIIEHLSELLIQSKSHEELSTLFKFVFKETPTWNEINNRTFETYPIFALNRKKELSKIENSSLNLKWQASLRENGTIESFLLSIPYDFIVSIIKSGFANSIKIKDWPATTRSLYSL